MKRYVHHPATLVRKSIFERVGDEFIHDEPDGDCLFATKIDLRDAHVDCDWPHVPQSITEVSATRS